MEPVEQVDPMGTFSTLSEFHSKGKYCDVKLQIGDEVFACQRLSLSAMSKYFDAMFSSNFKEKCSESDEPIVLHEIDGIAFREILLSMYTGNIRVSDSNVHALLCTSEFLLLRTSHVENQCFKYLQNYDSEKSDPISDAMEIFSLSCATKKERFVELLGVHILRNLQHFLKDARFVELSFEGLSTLLKLWRKNPHSSNDDRGNALLKMVIIWVNHSREERSDCRKQLMLNIDCQNVSSTFAVSLIEMYEEFIDNAKKMLNC